MTTTNQQPQAIPKKSEVAVCYWCNVDYFVVTSDADNKKKYCSRSCELTDESVGD